MSLSSKSQPLKKHALPSHLEYTEARGKIRESLIFKDNIVIILYKTPYFHLSMTLRLFSLRCVYISKALLIIMVIFINVGAISQPFIPNWYLCQLRDHFSNCMQQTMSINYLHENILSKYAYICSNCVRFKSSIRNLVGEKFSFDL